MIFHRVFVEASGHLCRKRFRSIPPQSCAALLGRRLLQVSQAQVGAGAALRAEMAVSLANAV